jgi:anti-anti-sigma regulatory factor
MLKITHETPAALGRTVLRLEGQIGGQWVEELRRAFAEVRRGSPMPLIVDLKEVTFIDHAGLALLDEIYPDITLINCSLFAAEQLRPVTERRLAVRT